MIFSCFVLVVSVGLSLFYLQATCERILRRRFSVSCCADIVRAYRLEFATLKGALTQGGPSADWTSLESALQGDFHSLNYLLRHACNTKRCITRDERLLMSYFRFTFLGLRFCHLFRLSETGCVMKLAAILQYFCDVLGERMNAVRAGQLQASDFLLGL